MRKIIKKPLESTEEVGVYKMELTAEETDADELIILTPDEEGPAETGPQG